MEFELPNELPDEVQALEDLRAQAVDAFNSVYDADKTPTESEFADLQALNDAIAKLDEAVAEIRAAAEADEAAVKRAEEAAAFADNANASPGAGGNGDQGAGNGAQSDQEGGNAFTPTDKDSGAANGDTGGDKNRRTDFAKAANGKTPEIPEDKGNEFGWRLTTSAVNFDPNVVDSLRVASEFGNLAKGRAARVIGAGGRSETTVAYFDRNVDDSFAVNDTEEALAVLDRVTNESNLPGGSLVAAGGWATPSERVYDFLPTQAATGLLSLPEIAVRRGGISFPVEPDFGAMYEAIGFHQTEAQAQAGDEKPCYEIPEADWEEVRLDVQGVCLTAGILQDKAWPEQTKKYVDEALRLHLHKISAWRIGQIADGSTNVGTLTGPMFGTAGAVLSALELQVADTRARHRLAPGQSLEGIAPAWLLSVIRADLAFRDRVLPDQVTDANIRAHFANIGVNLQFVADWQNDVLGQATPATAWPETVQVILYPAGTWWSATEPVINLGIIHDSTLLKQNRQIQMFTEDGVAVGKRGPESRLVTIPVAVNGMTGARHVAAVEAAAGE